MVKITNPLDYDFMKAECYGKPNTGKSTFAMSICRIKPKIPGKDKIVYFVNDPTYIKALKNFVDSIDQFDIYQHRTLEEFEADWDSFCTDYQYKTEEYRSCIHGVTTNGAEGLLSTVPEAEVITTR